MVCLKRAGAFAYKGDCVSREFFEPLALEACSVAHSCVNEQPRLADGASGFRCLENRWIPDNP